MPIYALGSLEPTISSEAYVHPDAVIIGTVYIGAGSSVWPCAVMRGDDGEIRVGDDTSIQDGSIIHTTPDLATLVGDRCVIGHAVHLEGCRVGNDALVGSNSVVLHDAVVADGALVAAGAVVLGGTQIPAGALAMGVPAKIREGAANQEEIRRGAQSYVERAKRFASDLRRLD